MSPSDTSTDDSEDEKIKTDEIFKTCQTLHRSSYPDSSLDFTKLDLSQRMKRSQRSIGRGAYSDVYKGSLDNGTRVAVKVLRLVAYSSMTETEYKDTILRFFRELNYWHGLEHVNIAQLLGFALKKGRIGLVSLWYANGNVVEYLKAHPQASKPDLILDVAQGIEYLHTHPQPVIHADLKGVNILIDKNGVACLGDFGISKRINDMNRKTGFTTASGVTGTLRWMAPELLTGGSLTPASDIYSFAGVVMEIWCPGKSPYHYISEDPKLIMIKHNGELPDRSYYPEFCDQNMLWSLITTCFSLHSEERPMITTITQELYNKFELSPRLTPSNPRRPALHNPLGGHHNKNTLPGQPQLSVTQDKQVVNIRDITDTTTVNARHTDIQDGPPDITLPALSQGRPTSHQVSATPPLPAGMSAEVAQVIQVLVNAAHRVAQEAQAAHALTQGPAKTQAQASLATQQRVIIATAHAVRQEAGLLQRSSESVTTSNVLAVAGHQVVSHAARLVQSDRTALAIMQHETSTPQPPPLVSLNDVSVMVQLIIAHAVAIASPASSEVEVMKAANALIQRRSRALSLNTGISSAMSPDTPRPPAASRVTPPILPTAASLDRHNMQQSVPRISSSFPPTKGAYSDIATSGMIPTATGQAVPVGTVIDSLLESVVKSSSSARQAYRRGERDEVNQQLEEMMASLRVVGGLGVGPWIGTPANNRYDIGKDGVQSGPSGKNIIPMAQIPGASGTSARHSDPARKRTTDSSLSQVEGCLTTRPNKALKLSSAPTKIEKGQSFSDKLGVLGSNGSFLSSTSTPSPSASTKNVPPPGSNEG